MKYLVFSLLLLLLTGCDGITTCNKQICEDNIMKFNTCRTQHSTILLDDNKQTIPCKGSK